VLLPGTSASSFGRALQVRATPPGLEPGAHLLSYEYPGDSHVFSKKTLCYFNTMLLFIIFLVCSSYMLDIVVIDDEFMYMFAKRLAQDTRGLSGRHYVSMMLKYCLPTNAFCTLGHVIDHGCDTPVESLVVHSLFVEQV
jgi:hypothetical protein